MPFFSITIPVYNVEKYLCQCLDSVLEQTFCDYEVIIIDDGSTDQSGAICDYYSNKDSRIRVYHGNNNGLLSARRRALQYVSGEYILFLDSDDYWEKDLLESVYCITVEYSTDLVYLRYKAVDGNGKELYRQKQLLKNREIIDSAGKFLCYKLATDFEYNPMWLKCIKRKKIDFLTDYSKVGDVSMGEDALQSVNLVGNIESMIYLSKPLYNYRVNIASISTKITKKYLYDYLKVRNVIDIRMKDFFEMEDEEFREKIAFDIRGFAVLLADSSLSQIINRKQWLEMRTEIIESSLFRNANKQYKNLTIISKLYLFFILYGNVWAWIILGRVKKLIKYIYDRKF